MGEDATKLPPFQAQLLADGLRELFGEMDEAALAALRPMLEWVEVAGGEVVLRQGGTDRDVYFVICGLLRAYREDGGVSRALVKIARGEAIGEMAFFTGAPRYATVVALRDSVLVRISQPSLETLLTAYPQVALNMTRLVIARFSAPSGARRPSPTNLCLYPITGGVDVIALGKRLVAGFSGQGERILLTSAALDAKLGVPGIANVDKSKGDAYRQLTKALDELESRCASVVYVPDEDLRSEWSQRCLRMADRVLLLAQASAPAAVGEIEEAYLRSDARITGAEQFLVLLHDQDTVVPSGTAEWLDRRAGAPMAGHMHLRTRRDADVTRLARLQSGRATGLVLCGGGARCFAHLGVYKALREHGMQVDFVGGTGMGAVMGALIALDAPPEELIAYAREAFTANPTGDVAVMPLVSLIRGRKLKAVLDAAIEHLAGADTRIEDTWRTFFCVASNYSKAREEVLRRGNLAKSIRASAAVPGLLPPVPIDGDLMVDGGAFNNYPIDVMAGAGVARIIGVSIARDASQEFAHDEVPGSATLAWDRLTGRRRKYRVPSLMSILMNATKLYGTSRERSVASAADLEFRLNLPSVGILDWHAFDHAVDVGYRNACKTLAAWPEDKIAPYRAS